MPPKASRPILISYMKDRIVNGDCVDSKLITVEIYAQTIKGAVKKLKSKWKTSRQQITRVCDLPFEFGPDDLPDF